MDKFYVLFGLVHRNMTTTACRKMKNNSVLIIEKKAVFALRKRNDQIVIYIIHGSSIRNFIIMDIIISTSIYYALKHLTSSNLLATAGSMFIGTPLKKVQGLLVKIPLVAVFAHRLP